MKATKAEIETLLASHHIASPETGGSSSTAAATGGRIGSLSLFRRDDAPVLTLTIGSAGVEAPAPGDAARAHAIVSKVQSEAMLPDDPSFESMLAELLVRASRMFADSGAIRLDFTSLHLHPASYHIGEVTLLHDKPLHLKARLEPDSHDRRAVFSHRGGDDTKFPR